MWPGDPTTPAMMEPALQMIMMAKRMAPVLWMSQYMTRLAGQCLHRGAGGDPPPMCRLTGDAPDCPPGNGRDSLEQMTRLRISMEGLRHSSYAFRELGSGPGNSANDLWQRLPGEWRYCFGRNGKQFARRHSDQGKKVLSRLIF